MPEPRLLVVEDDAALADLFVTALADEGYAVDHATSSEQAIALLGSQPPDAYALVLTNPFVSVRDDPYAQLANLRAATTAPIVICSGHPAARYADYPARGYAAFLQEPFDLQDLINLVASLTNGRGE